MVKEGLDNDICQNRCGRHHVCSVTAVLSLCDPMDCSPAVSSVLGILQVRILEWVVMPSSRGSSQPVSPVFTGRFFSISATGEALGRHHGLEMIPHPTPTPPQSCLAQLSVLIIK